MKREVQTSAGVAAVTSDLWHVVRARMTHPGAKRPYVRTVESEHLDRASCVRAARALRRRVAAESGGVPEAERDEVVVRHPNFKSLKVARSLRRRRAARKRGADPGETAAKTD